MISNHIGGTATCHTKAICEICRNGYGEFDETKHDGGTVIRDAVTVTCTENGYTGDIYCAGCDELLERGNVIEADGHTGGRATCTEKAVCDICGKSYGETDPDGHDKLVHIDAKAATEDSEGNIEYWHCEVCGKYYADAEASQEIAEADTVTKKLTPKTADITPAKGCVRRESTRNGRYNFRRNGYSASDERYGGCGIGILGQKEKALGKINNRI